MKTKPNYSIIPIRAFTDNYIWMFRKQGGDRAVVVDPGDATPVLEQLNGDGTTLAAILITHHHPDHVGGVAELLRYFSVPVFGPANSPAKCIENRLCEGDKLEILDLKFSVLEVPGHTLDHIAYVAYPENDAPILFCGDTLFAAGCGRLFEGTAPQMHHSLLKLAALPDSTRVFCTHEYTLANLKFAKAVEPGNTQLAKRIDAEKSRRERDEPTLPSSIGLEKSTNPFLRADIPEVITSAQKRSGDEHPGTVDVFATLRAWKDNF